VAIVAFLAGCRTVGGVVGQPPRALEEPPPSGEPSPTAPTDPTAPPQPRAVTITRRTSEIPPGFPSRVASVAFDVQVHPPGQAEIAGFVQNRDGRPVDRACVELDAGGSKSGPSPVFTSVQGNFQFARVPAGKARITITVENLEVVGTNRIPDYHTHDPRLAVMLRALIVSPPGNRFTVAPIKREGEFPDGDGTRWIEVAPLALDLQGYSPACRRALRR
jgi:hypothetical protein